MTPSLSPSVRFLAVVGLGLGLSLLTTDAFAQKKGKAGKKADGPSAAETWTDPIEKEQSDKGPYAPQSPKDEEAEAAPAPEKPKAKDPGRKRDKFNAFGQLLIGFGEAPLNNPEYSRTGKGTVIGLQVGARYDITNAFSLGLRVPLTTASVRQIDGKNLSTTAFGSPEVFGEYRLALDKLSSVPIGIGFGIPVAEGNPDRSNRADTEGTAKDTVNRLADATSGWKDSELFQPKRMPIIIRGGFHHDRRDWELHADAKFVLLPALKTEVTNPQEEPIGSGEYVARGFAMRQVTVLGGTYNFIDQPTLYGGLDLAFVWTPIQTFDFEPTANTNKPSTLQLVLEPKVGVRFKHFTPSVGYIAPLGGRLGSGGIGGIRLHLDVHL